MTAKPPAAKSKPAAKRAPARKAATAASSTPKLAAPSAIAQTIASPPETPAAGPVVEPVVKSVAATAAIIPFATAFTTNLLPKEPIMATAFGTTQDAVRTTVETLNAQTEAAVNNSKAAMEQVAAKSKEAVEASMKSLDELNDMARANIDALIASARVATTGVEQVMTHLTEVSKKSFEETTSMMKGLTAAKTPNELMQLQSDFAKAQFDSAVAEYSKLTEMMVKLVGDVMEPMQNQVAVSTDKMKAVWSAK